MMAGFSFCGLGMWKQTQVQILGLVLPPVVTPWVRTAGPFGVARCHTENRLVVALEGPIRIVGSGAAQGVNPPRGRWHPRLRLEQLTLC